MVLGFQPKIASSEYVREKLSKINNRPNDNNLEKEMATHSSILAWRIPWMEELGGLQSMGLQRVGHDWACVHVFPVSGLELTW